MCHCIDWQREGEDSGVWEVIPTPSRENLFRICVVNFSCFLFHLWPCPWWMLTSLTDDELSKPAHVWLWWQLRNDQGYSSFLLVYVDSWVHELRVSLDREAWPFLSSAQRRKPLTTWAQRCDPSKDMIQGSKRAAVTAQIKQYGMQEYLKQVINKTFIHSLKHTFSLFFLNSCIYWACWQHQRNSSNDIFWTCAHGMF